MTGVWVINLLFFNGCGLINHLQFGSLAIECYVLLSSWVQWLSMVELPPARHVGPWSLCWTIFRASLKKLRPWHAPLGCVSFWSSDSLLIHVVPVSSVIREEPVSQWQCHTCFRCTTTFVQREWWKPARCFMIAAEFCFATIAVSFCFQWRNAVFS